MDEAFKLTARVAGIDIALACALIGFVTGFFWVMGTRLAQWIILWSLTITIKENKPEKHDAKAS